MSQTLRKISENVNRLIDDTPNLSGLAVTIDFSHGHFEAKDTEERRPPGRNTEMPVIPINRDLLTWGMAQDCLLPAVEYLRTRYDLFAETLEQVRSCHSELENLRQSERYKKELGESHRSRLVQLDRQISKTREELDRLDESFDGPLDPEALEHKQARESLETDIEKYADAAQSSYSWRVYLLIAITIFAVDGVVNYYICREVIGLDVEFSVGLALGIAAAFSTSAHIIGKWFKAGKRISTTAKTEDRSRLSRIGQRVRTGLKIFFAGYLVFTGALLLLLPRWSHFTSTAPSGGRNRDTVMSGGMGENLPSIGSANLETEYGLYLILATFAIAGFAIVNAAYFHEAFPERSKLKARYDDTKKTLNDRQAELEDRQEKLEIFRASLVEKILKPKISVKHFSTRLNHYETRLDRYYSLFKDCEIVSNILNIALDKRRAELIRSCNVGHGALNINFRDISSEDGRSLGQEEYQNLEFQIKPSDLIAMVKDFRILHAKTIPLRTASALPFLDPPRESSDA